MAVTVEYSTQYSNELAGVMNSAVETSKVRVKHFSFTQGDDAGDIGSSAELVKLPAGRVTVYPKLSVLTNSAFGAARVLDVGFKAYTSETGASVSASTNYFDNDIDVSAGASAALGTDISDASKTKAFASQSGVVLVAVVAGGTIPASATLNGYIVYSVE